MNIGQPAPPLVVVSILNWNGWRETLVCLGSVRRLDYPNYLIVVVDNGSRNDSVDRIKDWTRENLAPGCVLAEYSGEAAIRGGEEETEAALDRAPSAQRLVLIRNEENKGFSGGHNVAIHYALTKKQRAAYFFLLNNDAVVPPDCLTRLISIQQSTHAGIVGPIVTEKDGFPAGAGGPFSFRASFFAPFVHDREEPGTLDKPYLNSDFVIGTAMLIGRDLLTVIRASCGEYLPSDLFLYGEEQAFCFAAKRRNYVVVMAKDVVVEHLGSRSAGGKGSTLMYYYPQRNSVLLARLMLPFHHRILFYALHLTVATGRITKNLLRRRPKVAWAVFRGILDGYRGRVGKWKYHDREAIPSD